MKRLNNSRLITVVSSVFIAISGFLSLLIDEVFKPFLDSVPEVKLIIILLSVISAYHVFLSFSIRNIIKEEQVITNEKLDVLNGKNDFVQNLIPFSSLDEIEQKHGRDNQNRTGTCEVWIIANVLQESKQKDNNDDLINAIYDNITKYRVHYYYILPKTDKSMREMESLASRLRQLHKKKKRRIITGGISFKYDSSYADTIISDYFDIILYIDCDQDGKPCLHGKSTVCEGYQCFSNLSKDNMYFYQKIENDDKMFSIRNSHNIEDFEQLIIE